jgi:hypothetical protein
MEQFDEASIVRRLSRLNRRDRSAFALACAKRLDGLLEGVSLEERAVVRECRALLERVTSRLPAPETELHAPLARLESLESLDVDAVASVACALRSWLKDSPQEAAWAARRAYEAQDQVAQLEMGGSGFDDQRLLAHPAVQRELRAQVSDLDALAERGNA